MRKALILLLIVALTALPGAAVEFTAPEAPENVQDLVPREPETFGEGLWYVVKKALGKLQPALVEAAQTCLSVIAAVLSSNVDTAIERNVCMAGEVGLSGEIRPVARIGQRISEAAKLGFSTILIPEGNLKGLETQIHAIEIIPVGRVETALRCLFG